jgi:antitoxin (DNA-binding transcriptional repressor) of toxin-antitoxin stability system
VNLPICGIIVYAIEVKMRLERVGIREFREKLSGYLESSTPVAITRHGETIGFYVPARRRPDEADLDAIRRAGERLSAALADAGATEDELAEEFKKLRKRRKEAS